MVFCAILVTDNKSLYCFRLLKCHIHIRVIFKQGIDKVRRVSIVKDYFQILDTLDIFDQAPIDAEDPNQILTDHIRKREMNKEFLTAIAKRCYAKSVSDKLSEILKI